jgi:hypothetical protein
MSYILQLLYGLFIHTFRAAYTANNFTIDDQTRRARTVSLTPLNGRTIV